MNNKDFYIEPNEELINKARIALRKKIDVHSSNKMDYYRELENIREEIFEYKNTIFKEAEEYLSNDNIHLEKTATIYLDIEIEKIIKEIFDRECNLFNSDNMGTSIVVKTRNKE